MPSNDDERVSYLEKVIGKDPDNPYLQERLEVLLHPVTPEPDGIEEADAQSGDGEVAAAETPSAETPTPEPIPICGISQ